MDIEIIATENITGLIYLIRGKKVMLDRDLAPLYGVETKVFKQAVRRNIERFLQDFMFELSKSEFMNWRSQFVTSNRDKMGLRYSPMLFTEQGVAMLFSVLRSKTAIQVNIQIMRAFTKMRQLILDNAELRKEFEDLKADTGGKFLIVIVGSMKRESPETRKPRGLFPQGFTLYVKHLEWIFFGSPARTRTADKMVNSHLLYLLSYWGIFRKNAYLYEKKNTVNKILWVFQAVKYRRRSWIFNLCPSRNGRFWFSTRPEHF
jgi:hypothetical protein